MRRPLQSFFAWQISNVLEAKKGWPGISTLDADKAIAEIILREETALQALFAREEDE
jgi:hypothetical protein